jgi:cytochrome b pre-mRNA-processing protein 3
LMFKSIDLSFREEGVGDLSIPKKMKKVGMVFYGRIENLDRILEIEEFHTKHQELSNYFLRNAFLSNSDYMDASEAFVIYTLGFEELLETLSISEIEDLSFNASKFFT